MDILDKIQFLLKSQGKTQKELTDHLGVSKATFSQWKSGCSKSYLRFLPQIADFFSVSVDYLLGKTEEKTPSAPSAESTLDEKKKYLIDLLSKLDDKHLAEFIKYAEFLKSKDN